MSILITICARGGSKGVPKKNIKPLNGKPLIAYTIGHAKQFAERHGADIGLSTDDPEIIATAAEWGVKTDYVRPADLASDTAGKIEVIASLKAYEEAKRGKKYDYVLDLDVSAPMRTLHDLETAFARLKADKQAFNIFSVSPAHRNPYFNMVEVHPDSYARLVKSSAEVKSRQQAPPVYDMNASFYIFTKEFFDKGMTSSITSASLAYVMEHISFDIDHPIDFTMMELMIKNNLLTFEL